MTLLYDAPAKPGTHVLAIGVGSYPYLLGGTKTLTDKPLGLRQLQSPPVSASAVLSWFLTTTPTSGLVNPNAPLASVEALISASSPVAFDTPKGKLAVESADRQNIQDAFEAWLERLKSHPDNVGLFYFCGHGIMTSEHYLLAEDFGRSNAQPWVHAFDLSNTIRAVERETSASVFYFIDSCRVISTDVATTLGATPLALKAVDLNKPVIRKSRTIIYAAGEGELAFAPPGGEVSRFTTSLLCALSGYAGLKCPGVSTWNVDGEVIATAIRQLLEFEAQTSPNKQVSEQSVQGVSVPLLVLSAPPKVKVSLDLAPTRLRVLYEIYLESARGARFAQTLLDQVFKTEVPRGFYDIGARDPGGKLQPVIHQEEELTPPLYNLTLQAP